MKNIEYGTLVQKNRLDRMSENAAYVRYIKKQLLAALYNAPATRSSDYTSLVSHDFYGGGR